MEKEKPRRRFQRRGRELFYREVTTASGLVQPVSELDVLVVAYRDFIPKTP
jgi:hypothetical protein